MVVISQLGAIAASDASPFINKDLRRARLQNRQEELEPGRCPWSVALSMLQTFPRRILALLLLVALCGRETVTTAARCKQAS